MARWFRFRSRNDVQKDRAKI